MSLPFRFGRRVVVTVVALALVGAALALAVASRTHSTSTRPSAAPAEWSYTALDTAIRSAWRPGYLSAGASPALLAAARPSFSAPGVASATGPDRATRTTAALGFGPATVVDVQRTEGEPLLHIDKDGKYWESGPWGFSTTQSFVHRSVDGGDQFNVVSPTALRPNPPPGGGDTTHAIDDQGVVYFGDLEGALNELDCSVSNDNGNTWKKNPACVPFTGTDRQWLAVDNGSNHSIGAAGAADNTVFYAYHDVALGHLIFSSPGSTGQADAVGGLVFSSATSNATGLFYNGGGNCGELVFDPVNRNLYYSCAADDHVEVIKGHVNPLQRTGITFTTTVLANSPGGSVSNLFPPLSVDSAGNVYVVWSDPADHNLYYCYSTDQAATFSCTGVTPPVKINSSPANTNVFAWAEAGNAGNLVAVWLGNSSNLLSDDMPNWNDDPAGADGFPWFGYVALIQNANTATPTINQSRFTEKPMHYGQICNGGIGCTAQVPQGDRVMADFLSVDLTADGAIQILYNDTTSQHHGAHLFLERQLSGPTAIGTTLSKPVPSSPVFDPSGDAQTPHYSPTGAGPNQPQLDLRSVAVNQQDANTLRVRMTVDNLTGMAAPPGKASAFWITRFQALSKNDTGAAEAYRIFYVGAEATGGQLGFFAGSPNRDGPPVGCNSTTACKVVQYPPELINPAGVTGSVSGNTICVDLPLAAFGAGRPIGTTLFNVTGFTGGRNNAATDIYTEGDAAMPFDFALGHVASTPCVPPGPTAVQLQSFAGRAERGRVVLNWKTASEVGLLGFDVWRRDAAGHSRKVNRSLVAARGKVTGASYRLVDRTVRPGRAYTYRLRLVTRAGARSWSSAIRVRSVR